MASVRKIDRRPSSGMNHYVVDACFLVNRYIPQRYVPPGKELSRGQACNAWWDEIEDQLDRRTMVVVGGHGRAWRWRPEPPRARSA